MDRVQRGGPWTGSTGVVHGPGVHVLYTSDENSDEVPKKVVAALKNSQKTKKRLKRQEKQLQAIVSQRLHLPRREPRR